MFAVIVILILLLINVSAVPFFYTTSNPVNTNNFHDHHTSLNVSEFGLYEDLIYCRTKEYKIERRNFMQDHITDVQANIFEDRSTIYVTFSNMKPLDFSTIDNHPNATVPILSSISSRAATSIDLVTTLKFFYPLIIGVLETKFLTNKRIIVIGSQYGGSLAEVFAYQLIFGENVEVEEVWTFNSLSAGDSEFARKLCKHLKKGYNIKNSYHFQYEEQAKFERERFQFSNALTQVETRYNPDLKSFC